MVQKVRANIVRQCSQPRLESVQHLNLELGIQIKVQLGPLIKNAPFYYSNIQAHFNNGNKNIYSFLCAHQNKFTHCIVRRKCKFLIIKCYYSLLQFMYNFHHFLYHIIGSHFICNNYIISIFLISCFEFIKTVDFH